MLKFIDQAGMRGRAGVVAVCLMAGGLSGCVVSLTPQMKPVFDTSDKTPESKPPSLAKWQAEGPVKFFLVHGMNDDPFGADWQDALKETSYHDLERQLNDWDHQSPDFQNAVREAAVGNQFSGFIGNYAKKAHLTEQTSMEENENAPYDFELIQDPYGTVIGYTFKRSFLTSGSNAVDFYVTCWCVHDSEVKEAKYGATSGNKPWGESWDYRQEYQNYRHYVNGLLKHSVVEWGLTDAALYLSNGRGEFEWAVATGISRMAAELKSDDRMVVLTESLGSTITYNVLKHFSGDKVIYGRPWKWTDAQQAGWTSFLHKQGTGAEARIAFYMMANQYALLSTDEQKPSGMGPMMKEAAEPVDHPAQVLGAAFKKTPGAPPIQLVAFTDPDDLLSFRLPTEGAPSNIQIRNVIVNNNWYAIGLFVGPVEAVDATNPLNSHTGYDTNGKVLDVMLNGIKE